MGFKQIVELQPVGPDIVRCAVSLMIANARGSGLPGPSLLDDATGVERSIGGIPPICSD
jgi:hypothetical protein